MGLDVSRESKRIEPLHALARKKKLRGTKMELNLLKRWSPEHAGERASRERFTKCTYSIDDHPGPNRESEREAKDARRIFVVLSTPAQWQREGTCVCWLRGVAEVNARALHRRRAEHPRAPQKFV